MDSWTSPVFALRGFRTAYDCFCQKHLGIALIRSILSEVEIFIVCGI